MGALTLPEILAESYQPDGTAENSRTWESGARRFGDPAVS